MGLPRDLLPVALALAFFVPAPARAARELPLDHASLAQRPAPFVDPLHPLADWPELLEGKPSYGDLVRLGELFQDQPLDVAATILARSGASGPAVEYALGLAYETQGRPVEALAHYRRVTPSGRVRLAIDAAAGAARVEARLRELREAPVRCPTDRPALFAMEDDEGRIHLDRTPLLLVHGYGGSAADLHSVAMRFRRLGRQIFVACYASRTQTVRESGHQLAYMVNAMRAHGVSGDLVVLAHSLGGLVTRMALNELTLSPRAPLRHWASVRFIAVDSPWHGYVGPADEGPEADFFRAVRPLLPRGMWQLRARSALFVGNPKSPDPVERAGLFGVELPDNVRVDLAFAHDHTDHIMSYHDVVLHDLPARLVGWFVHDRPVRGDARVENFWRALQSATVYSEFSASLRDAADDNRLDEAAVRHALAWYYPVFPGDHSTVLDEHPNGAGLLDHLVALLSRSSDRRAELHADLDEPELRLN